MKRFLCVLLTTFLITTSSYAKEITDIDSIPPYLLQQLSRAQYIEQYVAQALQTIRQNASDNISLSQEDIEKQRQQYEAEQRSSQIAKILRMDKDGDGQVTKAEVEESINANYSQGNQAMPPKRIEQQVQRSMQQDTDSNGIITYEEMRNVTIQGHRQRKFNQMQDVLSLAPNGDGVITVTELMKLAQQAFSVLDTDRNGILSHEEKKALQERQRQIQLQQRKQTEIDRYSNQISDRIVLPSNGEVHAVGVYEGGQSRNHSIQNITVNVKRENVPLVLVLSSYEPAIWHINKTDKVNIVGVIASGYYDQKVKGIDKETKLVRYTFKNNHNNRNVPYFFVYDKHKKQNEFNKMRNVVKAVTDNDITSFQGAYTSSSFNIEDKTVFAYNNAFDFHPEYTFPVNTEAHMVGAERGRRPNPSSTRDRNHRRTLHETVDINIAANNNPILLVLSSPNPITWNLINEHSTVIKGIILSGSLQQNLSGTLAPDTGIIYRFTDGHAYKSEGYKALMKEVKNLTGIEVISFRGGASPEKITIAAGKYFPTKEDITRMTGKVDIPAKHTAYSEPKDHQYIVPKSCNTLNVMAWGGGGAGGSWAGFGNYGGGAGYAYSQLSVKEHEKLNIIVGGGGKVGLQREKAHSGQKAFLGKGGYPDGGDGGIGDDGTGGGGGGASRVKRGDVSLIVAGGGGGGGGHAGTGAEGGGRDAYQIGYPGRSNGARSYSQKTNAKGGNNGQGGKAGITDAYRDDSYTSGTNGTALKGGNGGRGGRKGGGGGGGGNGAGGGGGSSVHFPGGGGGGGNLGAVTLPGDGSNVGNMAQASGAGQGGNSAQDGADGKVILWCNEG